MQVGDLIAERFQLDALAGAGAMGRVFRARDCANHGRLVAVKTFAHHEAGSSTATRFVRESAALAQVQHPAVVAHVAHGVTSHGDAFLAMEWVEGPTLAEHLAGTGLSVLDTLRLCECVLGGLVALHARDVIHRDLKPSNIMLPGGHAHEAKILDLGVARLSRATADLTAQGSHVGTPRYMAPEQIRDPRRVDGRADVFALGCILFECLTGVAAFAGDDSVAVLAQILFGQCVEPSELRAELPDELDRLVATMLARRPELRPSALQAQANHVAPLLTGQNLSRMAALPARVRSSLVGVAPAMLAETQCGASGERISSSPRLLDRASRPLHPVLSRPARRPLIGRDTDLAQLLGWLAEPHPITVWGGAGVGKTRLAHELARLAARQQLVPAFAIVICELGEARDSRDVVRIVAHEVGVTLSDRNHAEDLLGRTLGKLGDLLLILDRCEHLVAEIEPLLSFWARHAPRTRLVATSRVRLRSTREYELGPLETQEKAARVSPGAGVQARAQQPSAAASMADSAAGAVASAAAQWVLTLAASEAEADPAHARALAERIAAALEGNPLAIELALGHLPTLGLAGIAERLPDVTKRSTEPRVLPLAATMRDTIEWSWQLLTEVERWVFQQCAVFHGPFSVRAAEHVMLLPNAAGSVLQALDALRAQSLLSTRPVESAHTEQRLIMPAVLREFGREQLARTESREVAGVHARHAQYFARASQAQEGSGFDADDRQAALDHLLAQADVDVPAALSLLLSLEPQLVASGPAGRLCEQLDRVLGMLGLLAAAPQPMAAEPALAGARVRQLRARIAAPAGHLDSAQADLEAVLREAERLADAHLRGTALLDLGVVQHFRRDLTLAQQHYRDALVLLNETDDVVSEARCHGNLGALCHDQAHLDEAARGYRQAIALLPEQGQERLLANFLGNLALVEHERGDFTQARSLYERAIGLLENLLDARLFGIVLGNFGSLELACGADTAAEAHFARARALLEQSGDRRSEGLSLARLAAALALRGAMEQAERLSVQARRMLRRDPLAQQVVNLLGSFGELHRAHEALRERQTRPLHAALERVASVVREVRVVAVNDRLATDQSDDLRIYIAVLETRSATLLRASRAAPAS